MAGFSDLSICFFNLPFRSGIPEEGGGGAKFLCLPLRHAGSVFFLLLQFLNICTELLNGRNLCAFEFARTIPASS